MAGHLAPPTGTGDRPLPTIPAGLNVTFPHSSLDSETERVSSLFVALCDAVIKAIIFCRKRKVLIPRTASHYSIFFPDSVSYDSATPSAP